MESGSIQRAWGLGGSGVLFQALNRSGCEADHLHPSIVEVKNGWLNTFIPHMT
jgi:hypothetical protein